MVMKDKDVLEKLRFDLYSEMYYKEIDREYKIIPSFSLPASLIIIMAGIIPYYFNNLPYIQINLIFIAFFIIITIIIIFLIISLYYLSKSFYNYKYKYIESPDNLEKYKIDIEEYYKNKNVKNIHREVLTEFNNHILLRFKECTSHNAILNDSKEIYLFKSKKWIIRSIIVILLSCIPFFIIMQNYKYSNKTLGSKSMTDNSKNNDSNSNSQQTTNIKPKPSDPRIIQKGIDENGNDILKK